VVAEGTGAHPGHRVRVMLSEFLIWSVETEALNVRISLNQGYTFDQNGTGILVRVVKTFNIEY